MTFYILTKSIIKYESHYITANKYNSLIFDEKRKEKKIKTNKINNILLHHHFIIQSTTTIFYKPYH